MGTAQHRHLCSPSCPLERRPATAWLICVTCSWCPACQRLPSMGIGCKWDKLVQQWQISRHLIWAHTDEVWSDGAQQGPTAPASVQKWMSSSCSSHHAPRAPRKRGILWDFYRRHELPSAELRRDAKRPCWKGRPKHTAQHRYAGDWHVAIKKPSESSKPHW